MNCMPSSPCRVPGPVPARWPRCVVPLTRQIAHWCDMSGSAGAVPGAIHWPGGKGCRRLKQRWKSIWAHSLVYTGLDGARTHRRRHHALNTAPYQSSRGGMGELLHFLSACLMIPDCQCRLPLASLPPTHPLFLSVSSSQSTYKPPSSSPFLPSFFFLSLFTLVRFNKFQSFLAFLFLLCSFDLQASPVLLSLKTSKKAILTVSLSVDSFFILPVADKSLTFFAITQSLL